MEFPFGKLLRYRNLLESLTYWEDHFGRISPSVQPFLVPCSGKRADFYPFSGECPKTCIRCHSSDISIGELKKHLDVRLDALETTVIPNAVRGTATVHSASAGGKARAKQFQPKYEEAKNFMLDYHRKNPSISFTQIRKRAAQHLYLSEATLKNHVKKGDFTDW
jgi:hypothetical protein